MDSITVEQHLKNIDRDGFTVIDNAIDPGFVVSLRDTIRRIEAKEPNLVQGSILRTVGLLGLDPIFRRPPLPEEVLPRGLAHLGRESHPRRVAAGHAGLLSKRAAPRLRRPLPRHLRDRLSLY